MGLSIGGTRLRVHPLALMFPLMACLLGAGQDALALAIGLLAHESAHLLAARCLGVVVSQLRLMPIGGAILMENPYALRPSRLLIVAAAGPLGSAAMIVLGAALAHWGLLSPCFFMAVTRVNLALLLFNLLPALPLDGGRMLLCPVVPPHRPGAGRKDRDLERSRDGPRVAWVRRVERHAFGTPELISNIRGAVPVGQRPWRARGPVRRPRPGHA